MGDAAEQGSCKDARGLQKVFAVVYSTQAVQKKCVWERVVPSGLAGCSLRYSARPITDGSLLVAGTYSIGREQRHMQVISGHRRRR
jgi:hypothetical protein